VNQYRVKIADHLGRVEVPKIDGYVMGGRVHQLDEGALEAVLEAVGDRNVTIIDLVRPKFVHPAPTPEAPKAEAKPEEAKPEEAKPEEAPKAEAKKPKKVQ